MRKRLRSHEGANAVELALVLPILLMLIFGAITAGLTLNSKQQLDHAAREGARYGATLPQSAEPCDDSSPFRTWYECIRDQTLGAAVGTVSLSDGGVCVSHILDDGSVTSWLWGNIEDSGGNAGSPAGVNTSAKCFNENPSLSQTRVQVVVESPARLDAVFVRTGIFALRAKSVSLYEDGP